MTDLLLIGGGGHCLACIEVIESTGAWRIAGIVDLKNKIGSEILGHRVIGDDGDLPTLLRSHPDALVTVGQLGDPSLRIALFERLRGAGARLPSIVASTARVSRHASLGAGTLVFHQAFVNAGARVGENCIVNSGSIVEHGATIGDHCHVSTGAVVNGDCELGRGVFIGSGAILRQGVRLVEGCVVGAAAVVVKHLERPGIYVGCPATRVEPRA
jgi:sugar O-acyltransferase (sialic acid O-acetyltransferase NeuD family)